MLHFLNLTNGILCAGHAPAPRMMRLQSTWCEQKRWSDIILGVPDDLLYHLAVGTSLCVHDRSERPRVTRALWQGVPFVVMSCWASWHGRFGVVRSRSGMDVSAYAGLCYRGLSRTAKSRLRYYERHHEGKEPNVRLCDGRGGEIPLDRYHSTKPSSLGLSNLAGSIVQAPPRSFAPTAT